jgi:hypothetical protein
MSLVYHNNGWKSFDTGRIWRCNAPDFLLEVEREGHVPSFSGMAETLARVRRVRSFYAGKLNCGLLDQNGTALDIITANALTESLGAVPSKLNYPDLQRFFKNQSLHDKGDRLNALIDHIAGLEKYLVRKEPGYVNPIVTPSRVSVGAHHMLISTALDILKLNYATDKDDQIIDLVMKFASQSLFSATQAITYFNRSYSKHMNEPPLLAAIYNAGSLRPSPSNAWNLKQYGEHVDRWVSYYNTSRKLATVLTW